MYNDPVLLRSILIVIIQRDNLERMREGDPITLESPSNGGIMPIPKYILDYNMLIAYEEDEPKVMDFAKRRDWYGLVAYLERGRKFIKGVDGVENTKRIPHPKEH
jgi:hypothetical protein